MVQKGVEFYESLLNSYADIKIIESNSEYDSVTKLLERKADVALIMRSKLLYFF